MSRSTVHLIVETVGAQWYIVSSLCDRHDTTVISIERHTGRLLFTAQPGVDVFASAKEALQQISHGRKIFKSVTKCHALIGYYVVGSTAYLLAATRVSSDLVLPPRHRVNTIQDVEWLRIPLTYPAAQSKAELKNAEAMTEFLVKGAHYYCETLDLTRHYPSTHAVEDHDNEFCWNEFITQEFRNAGLGHWCCVLMQGIAVSKVIESEDAPSGVSVALIYRRSSLNPGTRYLSRGLNAKLSPGNEYEVEQILFREQHGVVNWSSYFWRRGTVPIHWKSEINSAVADADIIISKKPYERIDTYYKRIMNRYGPMSITILNLLRNKIAHPAEALLADHFEESLTVVKKLMSIEINMVHYDWHTLVKHDGLNKSVEGLWEIMGPKVREQSLTTGILRVSPEGKIMDTKVWRRQRGFSRINCADSLDRTNLCSFFVALHVLAEQCKDIGVSLCSSGKSTVDVVESWATLGYSLDAVKETFDKNLLHQYAEMFVIAGDVCATLFTSTLAMHTQALRDFAPNPRQAPSNTKIIVERRIQNVMKDRARQAQHEMFLGLKWAKYFPNHVKTVTEGRAIFLTPYPAFIFKSLSSEVKMNCPEEHCILNQNAKHSWICPRDFDFVELQIYLPMYCRVTELALTVRHGISELSSPGKMDVFVGTHLDDCVMGFQELAIPRCDDTTQLIYTLPPQISGMRSRNLLYDFHETDPQSLVRVVRIVFYDIPPGFFMTLGQVQLFGLQDTMTKTPKDFYLELSQMAANDVVDNIVEEVSTTLTIEQEDDEYDAPVQLAEKDGWEDEKDTTKQIDENVVSESDVRNGDDSSVQQTEEETKKQESHAGTDENNVAADTDSDDDADIDDSPLTPATGSAFTPANSDAPEVQPSNNIMSNYFHSRNTSLESLLVRSKSLKNKNNSSHDHEHDDDEEVDVAPNHDIADAKERYLSFLEAKCSDPNKTKIDFTSALELDLARLKLKLGQKDRDDVLVSNGFKVHKFNPNNFIFKRDVSVEKSIRSKAKQSTKSCTFCKTGIKLRKYMCRYCRNAFCKNCTSREKFKIIEFGWNGPQQTCIGCAEILIKQASMIKSIQEHMRAMSKQRQSLKESDVYADLFTKLYPPLSLTERKVEKKTTTEMLLSEFPTAGILSTVETADNSPPIESILFPPDLLSDKFWFAPESTNSVSVIVAFPCYSEVERIVMHVDKLGYHTHDIPTIHVSTAERLPRFVKHRVWDLSQEGKATTDTEEGESESERDIVIRPHQCLEYRFNAKDKKKDPEIPYGVRLMKLELTLPPLPAEENESQQEHRQEDGSEGSAPTRTTSSSSFSFSPSSSSATQRLRRMLHMGRILVFGKAISHDDTHIDLSTRDQNKYESILKTNQRTSRVQLNTKVQFHRETNTLDVIPTASHKSYVSGFRIVVDHGREGMDTQVRRLRVTLLVQNEQNGLTEQHQAGVYTIPRVAAGTSLCYELDRTYENVTLVRFELEQNYGAKEFSYGKIFLNVVNF